MKARKSKSVQDYVIDGLVNYLNKDPLKRIHKTLSTMDRLNIFKSNQEPIRKVKEQLGNPESPWFQYVDTMKKELDTNVRKKLIRNLLFKASLQTRAKKMQLRKELEQNIPWAILMDPTSACNYNCTGCWAAEYDKTDSLSLELMDRIIREGKELTIYFYLFSGGEPLIRKKDIISLCEMHPDCYFLSFTNGSLVTEDFAKEVARVGNFTLAFSVDGFEEENDLRRGEGSFQRVIKAMDIMKKHGVFFGFSATYHRENTHIMGSDEFIDFMMARGCRFGWYFTYIPVGISSPEELVVTPEQRYWMYKKVRKIRNEKPIFVLDFWNDGEFTGGCVAGGRYYLHINAKGDVEPCAFIHYSNVNIKDVSLAEALRQPIFRQYYKNQPFSHNHLKPCPCLDHPNALRTMVNKSGAKSTQLNDFEKVEDLTAKCIEHSRGWGVLAEKIWSGKPVKINGNCHLPKSGILEKDKPKRKVSSKVKEK